MSQHPFANVNKIFRFTDAIFYIFLTLIGIICLFLNSTFFIKLYKTLYVFYHREIFCNMKNGCFSWKDFKFSHCGRNNMRLSVVLDLIQWRLLLNIYIWNLCKFPEVFFIARAVVPIVGRTLPRGEGVGDFVSLGSNFKFAIHPFAVLLLEK